AAVIKRDFEEKAPTETDIVARVDARAYNGRYDLLRDLALNLFWVNRYALTMYDKRPMRWRDVARQRAALFLPTFKPAQRGADAPGDGAPQPVPLGPLEDAGDRGGEAPRRRLRRRLLSAERRRRAVHSPGQRRPTRAGPPARAGAGDAARHPVPGDRRAAALRRHAACRGPLRVRGRVCLH